VVQLAGCKSRAGVVLRIVLRSQQFVSRTQGCKPTSIWDIGWLPCVDNPAYSGLVNFTTEPMADPAFNLH